MAGIGTRNVSIMINRIDGTLELTDTLDTGDRTNSIFTAELNGDGNTDRAVANLETQKQ